MNCRDNEPLLLAERDGVLTSDQHAALERHVADCPACQQRRVRLASAMIAFRDDAVSVQMPDIEQEWQRVRAQLSRDATRPAKQRPLAPVIWFGTTLAVAAALAFAYFGHQSKIPTAEPILPVNEIAQAEYVEGGDASASTMVYVDKESGWLVVWATDGDATTSG